MRRVMVTTLWSASALLMGALAEPCAATGEDGTRTDAGTTAVTAPATATVTATAATTPAADTGITARAATPAAGDGQTGTENPTAAASERENENKNRTTTDASSAASAPGTPAATQTAGAAPTNRADRALTMAEQLSALSATQARLEALTRQQAAPGAAPVTPPGDDAVQRAYASGVMLGRELLRSMEEQQRVGLVLPVSQVLQGLEDSVNRRPLQLDETTLAQQLAALDRDFTQRQREGLARQEADGRAYMAAFLAQPHSVRQRGSAYRIEESGTLPRLRRTDLVTVNMTVRLPDGTEIDNRGESGQAAQVRVDALMPAVTDALLHVGAGGRLTVVVAPERAYGQDGLPPAIPGGATLIVDIRVLGINRS